MSRNKKTYQPIQRTPSDRDSMEELCEIVEEICEREDVLAKYLTKKSVPRFILEYVKEHYKPKKGIGILSVVIGIVWAFFAALGMPGTGSQVFPHMLRMAVINPIRIFITLVLLRRFVLVIPGILAYRKYSADHNANQKNIKGWQSRLDSLRDKRLAVANRCGLDIRYWPFIPIMQQYFEVGRADTVKEARILLEEDVRHSQKVLAFDKMMSTLLDQEAAMRALADETHAAMVASQRAETASYMDAIGPH